MKLLSLTLLLSSLSFSALAVDPDHDPLYAGDSLDPIAACSSRSVNKAVQAYQMLKRAENTNSRRRIAMARTRVNRAMRALRSCRLTSRQNRRIEQSRNN